MAHSRGLVLRFFHVALPITLCAGSCRPTPHNVSKAAKLNRAVVQKLAPDSVRRRWQGFKDSANVFAPAVLLEHTSDEKERTLIGRFYDFIDAREKLQRARISPTERHAYQTTYLTILRQRAAVLDYLIGGPTSRLPVADTASSRTVALVPEQRKMLELDRVTTRKEIGTFMHQLAEPEVLNARARKQRVLCFEDFYGVLHCETEDQFARTLMQGHWTKEVKWSTDRIEVATAYDWALEMDRIFAMAPLIAARLGTPKDPNTFLACATGSFLLLKTSGSDPRLFGMGWPTSPGLVSLSMLRGMKAACNVFSSGGGTAGVGGSGAGLGGTDGNWVNQTIAAIDQQLQGCNNSVVGPFAQTGSSADANAIKRGVERLASAYFFTAADAAIHYFNYPGDDPRILLKEEAAAAREQAVEATSDAVAYDFYAQQAERRATVAKAEADAKQNVADANPNDQSAQDEATAARQAEVAAEKEAQRLRAEAEQKKQEAAAKNAEANQKATAAGVPATPTPPPDVPESPEGAGVGGDEFSSSCANTQARWELTKWYCTETGGWDRAGSACNEILRRANGCEDSDPRATNPNPEGGSQQSCFWFQPDESNLLIKACQAHQKVESPVGDDPSTDVCKESPPQSVGALWPDICADPRAMPTEDQCGGDLPVPISGTNVHIVPVPVGVGPGPSPVANVGVLAGVLIYDGLQLNGLGLGGLRKLTGERPSP